MSDAVIVGLITVIGSIIIQLIISHASAKDLYAKLDKQSEISDAKMQGEINVVKNELSNLRQEVSKHNSVIERTYALEKEQGIQAEHLSSIDRRVSNLEEK